RYDADMEKYHSQLVIVDKDWAAWADDEQWQAWFDDFDTRQSKGQATLVKTLAPCIAGGIVESIAENAGSANGTSAKDEATKTAGYTLWKSWLSMPSNPAFRVLLGGREDMLSKLSEEKDLYERAKAIYGSDEAGHFLHNEVKDAVSMAQE